MTMARDQVRDFLLQQTPPVVISENSDVLDLLHHVLPEALTTTNLERLWEHTAPACTADDDARSWEPGPGSRYVLKRDQVAKIQLSGEEGYNSNFKNVVDRWVRSTFEIY
jgi:hypothetical protein